MKSFLLTFSIGFILILGSCGNNASNEQQIPDAIEEKTDTLISVENAVKKDIKVEVLNFFGARRCATCSAIGENAKLALSENFSKEVEDGTVKFVEVNYEEDQNKDIVEKYEATGSGLYIHTIINGEETIENLTDFAFMTALNETDVYKEALRTNISEKLSK